MKKIIFSILGVVTIFTIIFVSCKKDTQNNSNDITTKNGMLKTQEIKYSYYGCTAEVNGECKPGVECKRTYANAECYKLMECCPVANIITGFTDDEIKQWVTGFEVLKHNPDFIKNHYNFYLELYNKGMGIHPDIIIGSYAATPIINYRPEPCITDDGELGVKCISSSYETCSCPAPMDCKAVECGNSFTIEEKQLWKEGKYNFDMTSEYIKKHYDFFLSIGKQRLSYHPDYLIATLL